MFATLFLGAILSVFLTLNVIRGDAEAGLLQPLVVRPVGRARLLLARFIGAAGVAALYVLGVYAATIAIADWAGGWTPDRLVAPGSRARCRRGRRQRARARRLGVLRADRERDRDADGVRRRADRRACSARSAMRSTRSGCSTSRASRGGCSRSTRSTRTHCTA